MPLNLFKKRGFEHFIRKKANQKTIDLAKKPQLALQYKARANIKAPENQQNQETM